MSDELQAAALEAMAELNKQRMFIRQLDKMNADLHQDVASLRRQVDVLTKLHGCGCHSCNQILGMKISSRPRERDVVDQALAKMRESE